MELRNALRTTGVVGEWHPEPVPDEVVYRILDTARFAPSGGNRQGWAVVLIKDPSTRAPLRGLYLPTWYEYLAQRMAGLVPFAPTNDPDAQAEAAAVAGTLAGGGGEFAEHLDRV